MAGWKLVLVGIGVTIILIQFPKGLWWRIIGCCFIILPLLIPKKKRTFTRMR